MDASQLRTLIVRPTLQELGLWSQEAEDLVMGTAAQESRLQFVHQKGGGPALGLWQDEPEDYVDLWKNWLAARPQLAAKARSACCLPGTDWPDPEVLVFNLRLGVVVCRLHYERAPGAIPLDLAGQAVYYKDHYNTAGGAATVDQYVTNYKALVA